MQHREQEANKNLLVVTAVLALSLLAVRRHDAVLLMSMHIGHYSMSGVSHHEDNKTGNSRQLGAT